MKRRHLASEKDIYWGSETEWLGEERYDEDGVNNLRWKIR